MVAAPPAQTTDSADSPAIVIEGPVQAINVNIITIANINITIAAADPLLTTLQVGDVVHVEGDVDDSSDVPLINASYVEASDSTIVAPLIAITGPVQAINVNIVTVYNINIQFNPGDEMLTQLVPGDVISVGGNLVSSSTSIVIIPVQVVIVGNVDTTEPEATPEPTPEVTVEPAPETGDEPVTVVVEGPVEAINVNIITVFDINIEVEPTAPILTNLHVGDHVHVEGNPRTEGNTIIIVAVNITIINVTIVNNNPGVIIVNPGLPDGCRISKNGKIKCSRKKKS